MEHKSDKVSQFYVVHFIEKPFEGIDYYVCVPFTWVILHKHGDNILIVAYPKNEDPSVTRERVLIKEKHQNEKSGWELCTAELKFQSDTYKDAERWIAEKKIRESSVSDNSAKKKLPWDYELRCGSQKYLSVSKDKSKKVVTPRQIPEKQVPDAKDKESLNEENKFYLKGLNLVRTETVKLTPQNTTTEPVPSTSNQSITIWDKQSIENAATNDAPKMEDSTHSSKRTNSNHSEQELMIDEDGHTKVNVKDQSQQEQHRETRNQNQLAATKPPSPVEQNPQNRHVLPKLRIKNIQDRTALSNNLQPVVNVSNEKPCTSQHLSSALTMSAELRNPALTSRIKLQNALIEVDPTKPLPQPLTKSSTGNIQKAHIETSLIITNNIKRATAASTAISPQDIQHVAAMIQNLPYPQEHKQTRKQDLAQRHTAHRFALRRLDNYPSEATHHQPIRPPVSNDLTNIPSQFYQPLDKQHRVQRGVTHQDAPQRPASISTLQGHNRPSPTLQGVQKTTLPPASPKAPKEIIQILVNALENYQWNEQEIQVILKAIMKQQTTSDVINGVSDTSAQQNHSLHSPEPMESSYESSTIEPPPVHRDFDQNRHMQNQVHRTNGTNSMRKRIRFQDEVERDTKQTTEESGCSTDVYMEEPMSSYYGEALDSGVDTDHEANSGYEMSVDEAHDAANDIKQTEYNSVDRSQNSSSKLELQKQMVKQFITICTTLSSSLRSATNMLDNLRDSFREISKSPQTYSDNQRFNTSENSVSHAPSCSNEMHQEVPPVVEERQILAAERRNSSNGNQQNDSINNAPDRIDMKNSREHPHSTGLFAVPSQDHPNDTKWTLKYQEGMPGVVELKPKSKIYVKFNELRRCEQVSTSCESLARLMLHEVFNKKALSVCASMREMAKAHYKQRPDARLPLDNHGLLVLFNYVIEYGIKCGWSVNEKKILQYLDDEIKEMRFKYGLMFYSQWSRSTKNGGKSITANKLPSFLKRRPSDKTFRENRKRNA